jgi:hypothetical protein
MKRHQHINPFNDMDRFVSNLHNEDKMNLKLSWIIQILVWAVVLLYSIKFLFFPKEGIIITERFGGFLILLSFVSFSLILCNLNKKYKSIDYGVSVVEMLTQATKRYKLIATEELQSIVPLLLMDLGVTMMLYNPESSISNIQYLLMSQSLFILCTGIVLGIAVLIWRKRQKPLRDAALAMLKEIES